MSADRGTGAAGLRALLAAAAIVLAATGATAAGAGSSFVPSARQVAQATNAPVQLGPRRSATPETAAPPPAATPPAPVDTAPVPTAVAPPPSGGTSGPVEIESLNAVDADSVGVIDDQEGGLGADMWNGADRAFVGRLLALLPRRVESPTMRDLMRRLLLTRAMAPARKGKEPSLLSLRVDALFAIGDLESAMALLASAPMGPVNERRLHLEVESRFFRDDTAGACGQVRGSAQDYKDRYWEQATAYCLALAGKTAEASLLSDILAERATSAHQAFFAAMDRLSGAAPPKVESMPDPSALYLSMMRTASLALPADVLTDASPAVQHAVALSPNAALDLRLAAAERAAASGVLSGKVLDDIYGAVPFDAPTLASPLSKAEADWGTRGRALLMRAATSQSVPAARAEVLQHAFQLARAKGGYRVTAVASHPLLTKMEPSPDLAWFAGAAARALITVGDFAAARKWIALDLSTAREKAGDRPVPGKLWPLAVLIGAEGSAEPTPDALQAWWDAQQQAGADNLTERARVFFGLLDAVDIQVPTALWAPILDVARPQGTIDPGSGLQITLRRAAAAGQRGDAVALALVALGDAGPAATNFVAVDMAVRALRKVKLAPEAGHIALEAAVAAGL